MSPRFLKTYKYLVFTVLFLVALGGSVRAMNAGLACPDWPLCFGDVIPDYHPQVYFEFIHRVVAGLVSIAVVVLNIQILRSPRMSGSVKKLCWFSWALLITQVIMGGLTVLMQLHEKVVALHLGLGTGFFATLLLIYLTAKKESGEPNSSVSKAWAEIGEHGRSLAVVATVLAAAVYGQIILGGLVASHYAALVCPEFPLCHGQWIPTLQGPIGLQVIHRLGAYTLFALGLAYMIFVFLKTRHPFWRQNAMYFMAGLLLQVCIGVANVLLKTPPLITVLHLAVGTALLGIAVRMAFMSNQNQRRAEALNTTLGSTLPFSVLS